MRLLHYLMLVPVLHGRSSVAISATPPAPTAAVQHRRLNPWSSPLSAGDIAVTAIQGDISPTKNFGLVVLREGGLPVGTTFFVSDTGLQYDAESECGVDFLQDGGAFVENFYEYTAPTDLPFQTVISFLHNHSDFTLKEGHQIYTESGEHDTPNLERGASGGDQIIVYDAPKYDTIGVGETRREPRRCQRLRRAAKNIDRGAAAGDAVDALADDADAVPPRGVVRDAEPEGGHVRGLQ